MPSAKSMIIKHKGAIIMIPDEIAQKVIEDVELRRKEKDKRQR